MKHLTPYLYFLLIGFLSSCFYDNEEELYPDGPISSASCDTTNVSYSQAVVPILDANCLNCHDEASATANIVLEGHENVLREVNSGRLIGSITHSPGFSPMPKNANQLPECEIATIQAWVSQGAENN